VSGPHTCACGRSFETEQELKWHEAGDQSRAHKLGILEQHDYGLQFCRNGDGTCGCYYVTSLFWRCEKCNAVVEAASLLERRFAIEMGLAGEHLDAARLAQDREAINTSRSYHRCEISPVAMAFRQDGSR
jgi:hypothetical protein